MLQRIFNPVYDFLVKALLWLDELVHQHPWFSLVVLAFVVLVVAHRYLRARDERIQRMVRNEVREVLSDRAFVRSLIGENFVNSWNDELSQTHAQMEERFRAFEATFTEEMRGALRDMVVSARSQGIPLQIQVSTTREADLLREALGGSVPVNVSPRRRTQASPAAEPSTIGTLSVGTSACR